jgi:glutamyl-tRNA(Gln) amidotransferase subunit E
MRDEDYYKSIGFMCGLELHQRLAVAKKLFCDCPTNIIPAIKENEWSIERQQRAIAGELGTIDMSSGFEAQKGRSFVYKVAEGRSCLVEIDEEPPHSINEEALHISLSFAKALNMKIVDEIQPMRKGVVDGSDPSAFQRTFMIAFDGYTEINGKRVEIPSIFLEEESCRSDSASGRKVIYSVDMLGVPLVEIDTWPYLRSPKEAKEVAMQIGTMMRISGKVQRGIGSIRQDVNVSIKGGSRVEIKGMQELESMDLLIDNEIIRQQELLKIRDELVKRKAAVGEKAKLTQIFNGTKAKLVSNSISKGGEVYGFKLSGFNGLLGREILPNRRLGTEISEYAKSAGVGGIIHSDESLAGYGFSQSEIDKVKKGLGVDDGDSFIIIVGEKEVIGTAIEFAILRAKYAISGVPPETRGAINDGTCSTRFLRPLPGGSRMYPETDVKPIQITEKMLAYASNSAPNLANEEKSLMLMLKDKVLAKRMLLSQKLGVFKELSERSQDPEFIANILLQKFTELRRAGFEVELISTQRLSELFSAYDKGELTKQAVEEVLKKLSEKDQSVGSIITKEGLSRIKGTELKRLVEKHVSEGKSKAELIKEIMSKHRLKIDGAELNNILK